MLAVAVVWCLVSPCILPAEARAATEDTSTATAEEVTQNADEQTIGEPEDAADVEVTVSADASSAVISGVDFGINDFARANKGTNKLYADTYYGYRFPVADRNAFAVMVCDGYAIVYIPEKSATAHSFDMTNQDDRDSFERMLLALDEAAANGGTPISDQELEFHYTTDTLYIMGDYTYRFGVEVESGSYYATVTRAGSEDGSSGAQFCDTGQLAAADDIVIIVEKTGFDAMLDFFTGIDYRPLWVSIKTSVVAMLFVFTFGLFAAWRSLKVNDRLKGVLDSIFTIPMVLPPTVCGFLLLVLFGQSTWFGRWLSDHGIELVFSWPAAVLAATVVAFPLMYRTARGAFEALDNTMLDAARTLGWSETKIFLRLMMPLAWPSVAAGTVLAFARAMGEFGATLFVAGNYPGVTQTMPLAIYFQWMGGHSDVATFWVFVVILFSFVVILLINLYSSRSQKYRSGGNIESDS